MKNVAFLAILLAVFLISSVSFANPNYSQANILKAYQLKSTPAINKTLSLKGLIFISQGDLTCNGHCRLTIKPVRNIHYHTNLKGEQVIVLPPEIFVRNWQMNYCLPKDKSIAASLVPLDEVKSIPTTPINITIAQPTYNKTTNTLNFKLSQAVSKMPATPQHLKKQLLVFVQDCY